AELLDRGGGSGVAGDDDRLDLVLLDEAPGQLAGVAAHGLGGLRTVRVPPGVADVDEVLGRQQVDHGPSDRQAAEAGVEHPDRPVHGPSGYDLAPPGERTPPLDPRHPAGRKVPRMTIREFIAQTEPIGTLGSVW